MEYWGLRPQYSVICPPRIPQDSPEGVLEGLQKLKCGAHPGQVSINETDEKAPFEIILEPFRNL